MTVPTSPLHTMNMQAGTMLLKEINKALFAAQAGQQSQGQKAKHPFAMPAAPQKTNDMTAVSPVAAPVAAASVDPMTGMMTTTPTSGDTSGADILSCLLGSLFMDFFLGMPLFQGLGGGMGMGMGAGFSEATQGLAHIGVMNAVDSQNTAPHLRGMPKASRSTSFDDILITAQQTEHLQAVANQTNKMRQMVMLRQMMAMLLTQMVNAQDQEEGKSGGGSDGLVPDVLRDPKLARFKQNRQSISCIRTLFQRQSDMIAPRHSAPQYKFAA